MIKQRALAWKGGREDGAVGISTFFSALHRRCPKCQENSDALSPPSPSAKLLCSFLAISQPAFDIFAKLLIGTKTRLEMVVGNGGTLSDRGRDYSRVDQETMF